MKSMFAILLTAVALHAAPVLADSPVSSPLTGKWAIDVAKLPMPPEARPKSVTLEFSTQADGKWNTQVKIVNPDGSTMHSDATLPLDGTPGPVTGDYWADVSAMKMPAPNVLVLQLAYKGTPSSTRIYTVTGDGKTLTETKAFFSKEGSPMLQTTTFSRIP
ncbi:LuxR family transcriptional regulator [Pseudoxanthomonas beigongshangi]|uniref:LuxR family transcriptional regulator n=1 Tax=Pseudoxanthomonas beigongshangi TaxID=2782537 RepID=UPI001F18F7FC|nr:LuxR family transcriptional regulator [Pseudoxanthomonas beigongshangi]UBB23913.1 LuxR family transcriptional regulator [Pseudoxanthomonas japonensis]